MDNNEMNVYSRTTEGNSLDINNKVASHEANIQDLTMSIEAVRERMQKLRQDVINQVDDQLNDMVSEVVEEIETIATAKSSVKKIYVDKKKPENNNALPEKVFETRNSILTDLFAEIGHMKAIYNIFSAILIILILNTAAHDLIDTGRLNLGFNTISSGFGKFSSVIRIELAMLLSSFCVYVVLNFWASKRLEMLPKSYRTKVWDYSWLSIFIIYQISFIFIPAIVIIRAELPPPSCVIVLMEQIRMLMKIHAFVRSVVPRVRSYKPHTDEKTSPFPGFSKFLYFMFIPTIVYRDNYPRTKEIKWRLVAWHFFEVILVILYVAFVFERFIIPVYKEFGREPMNLRSFVLKTFGATMPGITIFMCGFYCLLHAWMNTFAELLRFGDRLFYKDWWTSTTWGTFYRTWNVVVHDWLYTYIYKDIYENILPRRYFATFCVFFTSAIFHEYILSLAFRIFYPVMFLLFGIIGLTLVFIMKFSSNSTFGNIFMWFSLCIGSGMMISFYSMEFFARINCPPVHEGMWDLVLPRSWYCYKGYSDVS